MTHTKLVQNLRSGDQLVDSGQWYRVYGVDVTGTVVTVDSDLDRHGEYPVGTIVTVV